MIIVETDDEKIQEFTEGEVVQAQIVPYGKDMFRRAIRVLSTYPFAIAVDEEDNPLAILTWKQSTYIHRYQTQGRVDVSLLNRYGCIILRECNEYSVELCSVALKSWSGKKLVLIGQTWEPMIPYLDDIPGVE